MKQNFCNILSEYGWSSIQDGMFNYHGSTDIVLTVSDEKWVLKYLDEEVCEGGYAEKAYAVVENFLQENGFLI